MWCRDRCARPRTLLLLVLGGRVASRMRTRIGLARRSPRRRGTGRWLRSVRPARQQQLSLRVSVVREVRPRVPRRDAPSRREARPWHGRTNRRCRLLRRSGRGRSQQGARRAALRPLGCRSVRSPQPRRRGVQALVSRPDRSETRRVTTTRIPPRRPGPRTGCDTAAMTSTIVVCTDGSELAVAAADSGVAILRPGDRVLIVTAAAIDRTLASDGSGHAGPTMSELQLQEQIRIEHERADAIVERTASALGLSADCGRVLEGDAGPALCDFARSEQASAIVIGTRGRGGIKRALLGSVVRLRRAQRAVSGGRRRR